MRNITVRKIKIVPINEDGSVNIPEVLRSYMGGTEKLIPKK